MSKIDWNKLKNRLWAKKARPFTVLGALFLVFMAWQIVARLGGGGQAGGPRGAAVAVEIAAVERGGIRDIGTFSGNLIPKSYFTVVPKISGRIKALYVDIGDRLTRGQLVAVLEDEEYQQQVIQAEADLGVAKANLEEAQSAQELAQKELERAKTLHQRGILSDAELEAAQSAFSTRDARSKVTVAQLANQQAALETARVRLSYTRIRAAWETGGDARFVGERFVNSGADALVEYGHPVGHRAPADHRGHPRHGEGLLPAAARAVRRPDERRLSRPRFRGPGGPGRAHPQGDLPRGPGRDRRR